MRLLLPFLCVISACQTAHLPDEPVAAGQTATDVLKEESGRLFLEVDGSVHHALRESKSQYAEVVEVFFDREVSPDTLTVWVQHYGPQIMLDHRAYRADLIVSCYPEMLPGDLRRKHVLPAASGTVWVYRLPRLRMIYISDERNRLLEAILLPIGS